MRACACLLYPSTACCSRTAGLTGLTVPPAHPFSPLATTVPLALQLFFASVGASGSIATVMKTAPSLFLWSAIAVSSKYAPCFEPVTAIETVAQVPPQHSLIAPATAAAAHLGLVLAGERLLGFTRKESCLASNANIGGGLGWLHWAGQSNSCCLAAFYAAHHLTVPPADFW